MTESHLPAYLSPSRLSCYQWCPAEYRRRYVLGIKDPSTVEQAFGTAVHLGIETDMRGLDGDLAFLHSWRAAESLFQPEQKPFGSGLRTRGLELLEQVRKLDLHGEPEHRIGVTWPNIHVPFIGYVDLYAQGHIYDFKTSAYGWSQHQADGQLFQPAIYSMAHVDEFDTIPQFTYVSLPRVPGPIHTVDGTRTEEQIESAFKRAREILLLIEAEQFDCLCSKHEDPAA